jgi:hypothetical protein
VERGWRFSLAALVVRVGTIAVTEPRYKADITAGALKLPESRIIADLLLRNLDADGWKEAIVTRNVLQARNPATAKRLTKLIRSRLETMGPELWKLVRDGVGLVATHAALAAAVFTLLLKAVDPVIVLVAVPARLATSFGSRVYLLYEEVGVVQGQVMSRWPLLRELTIVPAHPAAASCSMAIATSTRSSPWWGGFRPLGGRLSWRGQSPRFRFLSCSPVDSSCLTPTCPRLSGLSPTFYAAISSSRNTGR